MMNLELTAQTIQYTFTGDQYPKGQKMRTFNNVKEGTTASSLAKVGRTLASLQKDTLASAVLVQKSNVVLE